MRDMESDDKPLVAAKPKPSSLARERREPNPADELSRQMQANQRWLMIEFAVAIVFGMLLWLAWEAIEDGPALQWIGDRKTLAFLVFGVAGAMVGWLSRFLSVTLMAAALGVVVMAGILGSGNETARGWNGMALLSVPLSNGIPFIVAAAVAHLLRPTRRRSDRLDHTDRPE